jgi:hypothetical protein
MLGRAAPVPLVQSLKAIGPLVLAVGHMDLLMGVAYTRGPVFVGVRPVSAGLSEASKTPRKAEKSVEFGVLDGEVRLALGKRLSIP